MRNMMEDITSLMKEKSLTAHEQPQDDEQPQGGGGLQSMQNTLINLIEMEKKSSVESVEPMLGNQVSMEAQHSQMSYEEVKQVDKDDDGY